MKAWTTLPFVFLAWRPAAAVISCTKDDDCTAVLADSSYCRMEEGFCSNPFHQGGCLQQFKPDWTRTRICHSDDPPEALSGGACRLSPIDYLEVRIQSQNWESAFFGAWILQIVLSEILDVPVSIETGTEGLSVDFYDVNSRFDYGKNSLDPLTTAFEVGDCRLVKQSQTYEPCAHMVPESWQENRIEAPALVARGVIEPPAALGALAGQFWYVPRLTAQRDASLANYNGLQGEANREKLARVFKRPTTWQDYCDLVSDSQCLETDNNVTARLPQTPVEASAYFVPGLYTGHFRASPENNCTASPDTCTGHFTDFPCSWASFFPQQSHHLGIALESNGNEPNGGYVYGELKQIWAAANATKSDIMMFWWTPEALFEDYLGTDYEFTRVVLPPPTQACVDARVNPIVRCGEVTFEESTGNARGACDTAPQSLSKLLVGNLRETFRDPDVAPEIWSPAYEVLQNYQLGELQMDVLFDSWKKVGLDKWGYDPRASTCQWVVDNWDLVQSYIPSTHPRVLEERSAAGNKVFRSALVLSAVVAFLTILSAVATRRNRKKRIILHAQTNVMYVMLAGLFLLAIGAALLSVPVTDATCAGIVVLVNIGYCLELVPVALRLDAINRLLSSGKQLRRVRIHARQLCVWVGTAVALVVAFLVFWFVMDPPRETWDYDLTNRQTAEGETIVLAVDHCNTDSETWIVIDVVWKMAVLLFSLVLAFMASAVTEDMNDTRNLMLLFLCQLMFAAVRLMLVVVEFSTNPADLMAYQSLVVSFDCIAVLAIFFLPKFLAVSEDEEETEALPDLFLRTTILYLNVTGFTAWSSSRSPSQVFQFLETIFGAFDELAEARKVLKVETVGDCYVAATGIPHDRSDHTLVLARFAMECMNRMRRLTKELEVIYGPETCELSLKIGLHSGAVTGGFLRGKGARFQVFGDTVNVCSRLQAASEKGRIHISSEAAALLKKAGKGNWLEKRDGKILVPGKGHIQTYWLDRYRQAVDGTAAANSDRDSNADADHDLWLISRQSEEADRQQRLVEWNVQVLLRLLKQICARRNASSSSSRLPLSRRSKNLDTDSSNGFELSVHDESTREYSIPIESIKEIIMLPEFDRNVAKRLQDADLVEIPDPIVQELTSFVSDIAALYNEHPFHNFAHASHVVMSMIKYMNRIVAGSSLGQDEEENCSKTKAAATLHDHTYGITSDPLTQFACVFAALIHDVSHPGVPNPQFIKEKPDLAVLYKGRSVAEQHSFDLSWNLFTQDRFTELRAMICNNSTELNRFRELVINAVMATDLGDKELKRLRNERWDKAFKVGSTEGTSSVAFESLNRKATIVIEHLIQASDVSHTMQHWDVYREWNENLFMEMYEAYRQGRVDRNPADFWFEGEMGFFDFYIVPLSQKLNDCGVFGISSDENLNYALENRKMWVSHGRRVVDELVKKAEAQ